MVRGILGIVESEGAGSNMWGAESTPLIRNPSRVWNTHGIVEAMQVLFRSKEGVVGEGEGGGSRRRP